MAIPGKPKFEHTKKKPDRTKFENEVFLFWVFSKKIRRGSIKEAAAIEKELNEVWLASTKISEWLRQRLMGLRQLNRTRLKMKSA